MQVRVETPSARAEVEALFPAGKCSVLTENLEMQIRAFERDLEQSRLGVAHVDATATGVSEVRARRQTGTWHSTYHRYGEIRDWYEEIADEFPLITKLVPSLGRSTEGRDMPVREPDLPLPPSLPPSFPA